MSAATVPPGVGAVPAPALARGLVVAPAPGGLLVEGGPGRQLFGGKAATDLLPRLLPLLDGRRSVADLAEECDLTPGQVGQALALLDRSGLLEHGATEPGPGPVGTFFSRSVSLTGRHRNAAAVAALLAETAVVVAAPGPTDLAEAIAADLRDTGVGLVIVAGSRIADGVLTRLAGAPARLAVLIDDDATAFTALAQRCRAEGIDVLRLGGSPTQLELGPTFAAGTACAECFHRGRSAAGWPDGGALDGVGDLAAGMAVAETVAVLTGLTRPLTARAVVRISGREPRTERFDVTPEPGCPLCRSPMTHDGAGAEVAAYEWLARPLPWAPPQADAGNVGDALERSDLTSSARSDIPAHLVEALAAAAARPVVDTYVLAVPGLPYPVYRHDPDAATLVATRADLPVPHWVPHGLPAGPAAVLVLVAAPGRFFRDRGDDSYRYAHLEAGAALARLIGATAGGPLRVVMASGIDGRLDDLLELRPGFERSAAVVGLYPRGDGDAALR